MSSDNESAKAVLEQVILKGMGITLDLARISGMGDRSFKQYERTIRLEYRRLINDANQMFDASQPSEE